MEYQECLDYIRSLAPTLEKPTLLRLERYFQEAGQPQSALPCFHVGGTNGKGSVTELIASMLGALGYRTGKFTGPHLLSFRERFVLGGFASEGSSPVAPASISEADFALSAQHVFEQSQQFAERHAELGPLTWFEFLTAMAVEYFCRSKVDRAVFEVGLGGRFDATNILNNILVSTICNVELDHMHLLGDTREKIAFEKAGIIKSGIPVVTACDGGPLEIICKQAASLQSPVVALKFSLAHGDPYRHFSATTFGASSRFAEQIQGCVGWIKEELLGDGLSNSQDAHQLEHLCGLAGAYQKGNVLLALFSLLIGQGYLSLLTDKGQESDGPSSLSKEDLKRKLLKGLKEASWPGRYQILESEKVILDGAHNPHGAGALRASLVQQFGGPFIFLFSAFENKNASQVLHNLLGAQSNGAHLLIAFASLSERAMHKPETLAQLALAQGAQAIVAEDFGTALALARLKQQEAPGKYSAYIIATGSFATVREAWRHFQLDDI